MTASAELLQELTAIQTAIKTLQPDGQATLVAVTKYATLEQMVRLYQAGVRHFGENKVQDALAKKEALEQLGTFSDITWHFIGRLQSNKVNKAVGRFDVIHSIDSLALAQKIDKRAAELGIRQTVLLQVNISKEESKEGFSEEALLDAWNALCELSHIHMIGLMTIAPAVVGEVMLKNVFNNLNGLLKTCRNKIHENCKNYEEILQNFRELSMGMSQDYSTALSCGATIIRVGRNLVRYA